MKELAKSVWEKDCLNGKDAGGRREKLLCSIMEGGLE